MNCYYSNLIEGHDTHPVDIERALKNDYSNDARKRDLQIEAKAHIAVQKWIDGGGLKGRAATTRGHLRNPSALWRIAAGGSALGGGPGYERTGSRVPGELRRRDVKVGTHVAVSPGAVPRFMKRFEEVYSQLGKTASILNTAAAHHRLVWIHPFIDGNGRVARLMSHAMLLETLDTGAVWSVARGLARNVESYKSHLAACDRTRRNDLDGRGIRARRHWRNLRTFFSVPASIRSHLWKA